MIRKSCDIDEKKIRDMHKEFFAGYQHFLTFEELEDWAKLEDITVKYLKKVYPIKDWARYYIHQVYKETQQIPKVRDLPKVVLQAYNSNSYNLYRAAGFRNPLDRHYALASTSFRIPEFKEADIFGVTINKFAEYPEGVFVDIPFKVGVTAHYFNPKTLTYVFYTHADTDVLYKNKVYYQKLYKGIFNIKLIVMGGSND